MVEVTSFSTTCAIEDGEYHVEADACTDLGKAHAEFTGVSLVDAVNSIIRDISEELEKQVQEQQELEEEKELTQEEYIKYLEDVVMDLRKQNSEFTDVIDRYRKKDELYENAVKRIIWGL